MPRAASAALDSAIGSRRPEVVMCAIRAMTTAMTAIGTLIQKMARQVHWVR